MANEGFLELSLLGVDGQPTADPATFVSFIRISDGQEIGSAKRSFPPVRRFEIPAFPQERAIGCRITPERYRTREVGIFTFTEDEVIPRAPTVFRVPQKWTATFDKWTELTKEFEPLQTCLNNSKSVRVKDGRVLGHFIEDVYDDLEPGDRVTVNAKACLLNLFAKLNTLKEPVFNRKPWFGFVETLLMVGRERFIALVDEEMHSRVKMISDNIDEFDFYKRTPVGDHAKNIPPGFTF